MEKIDYVKLIGEMMFGLNANSTMFYKLFETFRYNIKRDELTQEELLYFKYFLTQKQCREFFKSYESLTSITEEEAYRFVEYLINNEDSKDKKTKFLIDNYELLLKDKPTVLAYALINGYKISDNKKESTEDFELEQFLNAKSYLTTKNIKYLNYDNLHCFRRSYGKINYNSFPKNKIKNYCHLIIFLDDYDYSYTKEQGRIYIDEFKQYMEKYPDIVIPNFLNESVKFMLSDYTTDGQNRNTGQLTIDEYIAVNKLIGYTILADLINKKYIDKYKELLLPYKNKIEYDYQYLTDKDFIYKKQLTPLIKFVYNYVSSNN